MFDVNYPCRHITSQGQRILNLPPKFGLKMDSSKIRYEDPWHKSKADSLLVHRAHLAVEGSQ